MTRDQWLDTATSQIRFSPDRQRVRQELEDHMADRLDAAAARGLTNAEADVQVIAAMGDPAVIAPELGQLHSPWLGRLWWAIRAVTVAALIVTLLAFTESGFWFHLLGYGAPSIEIPPEQEVYDSMIYSRTGLWEDLDLGTISGYHFRMPVAYVQRLEVNGENGYETYSMQLQILSSTWRVWEPWEPDMGCITITDSTGCTYLPGDDPRTAEPFTPHFFFSGIRSGPGRSGINLSLTHVPQTPEWLELTIGDTVLHIDLEGGIGP